MFDCNNIYSIFAITMKKIIFTATALILSLYINAQDLQIPTDSATRSSEKEAFSLFKEKNYAQALIRYESAANMRQKMNIEYVFRLMLGHRFRRYWFTLCSTFLIWQQN